MRITSGPAIERVGDLASILTNLNKGDVLFIDEAHRLNKMVEEVLYPAMESGILNIIIGKGPGARTIQLDLPPFTLIAATTRIALISAPLRSRFSGGVYRLDPYSLADIESILARSAIILQVAIEGAAIAEISKRSRSTPRIANQLLKRVRDFGQVKNKKLTKETVREAFALLGIDELGLTHADKKMLELMIKKFKGGPVGLSTVALALGEDEATIEEIFEPYLIQLGLLEKTPRGRMVTDRGYAHVGIGRNQKHLL
jgi:Holliday junction DNA helicase RuvB